MGAVSSLHRRRRTQLAAGLWTLGFAVAPVCLAVRAGDTRVPLALAVALSAIAGLSSLAAAVIYRAATRRPDSPMAWMLPGVVSVAVTLLAGIAALPSGSWPASLGLGAWTAIIAALHLSTDRWSGDQSKLIPRPIPTLTLAPPSGSGGRGWTERSEGNPGECTARPDACSRSSRPTSVSNGSLESALNEPLPDTAIATDESDSDIEDESEESAPASRPGGDGDFISQWLTRVETAAGLERIRGVVSLHFAPGQKQAAAHVPIVPPLAGKPRVVCDVIGDGSTRARVTAAEPYGVRIEVKHSTPTDRPCRIEVSFTAESDRATREAA